MSAVDISFELLALKGQLPHELKACVCIIWSMIQPWWWGLIKVRLLRFPGTVISVGTNSRRGQDQLTFYNPQKRLHCSVGEDGRLDYHDRGPRDPFQVALGRSGQYGTRFTRVFCSAAFQIEVSEYGDILILEHWRKHFRSLDGLCWTQSACIGPAGHRLWVLADGVDGELVLTEFNCVGCQGHTFRVGLPEHVQPAPRLIRRVAAVYRFTGVEFCAGATLDERLFFFAPEFCLCPWHVWLPQFRHLKLAGWTALTSERCFVLCFQNGTILKFARAPVDN